MDDNATIEAPGTPGVRRDPVGPSPAAASRKPKKVRLDELLVARGDFVDAGEVLRAVVAREVRVDDVYVTSAAVKVRPDADVFLRGRRAYVSREIGRAHV